MWVKRFFELEVVATYMCTILRQQRFKLGISDAQNNAINEGQAPCTIEKTLDESEGEKKG